MVTTACISNQLFDSKNASDEKIVAMLMPSIVEKTINPTLFTLLLPTLLAVPQLHSFISSCSAHLLTVSYLLFKVFLNISMKVIKDKSEGAK